jgi:hypothetical protein
MARGLDLNLNIDVRAMLLSSLPNDGSGVSIDNLIESFA